MRILQLKVVLVNIAGQAIVCYPEIRQTVYLSEILEASHVQRTMRRSLMTRTLAKAVLAGPKAYLGYPLFAYYSCDDVLFVERREEIDIALILFYFSIDMWFIGYC